jgi:hypothetical protein
MTPSQNSERNAEIADLLIGAVDLHCHSGPAAMPRILDHHDAMLDAAAAKFSALVYKDHYYPGMSHCAMLEKLLPDLGVKVYSGVALNNSNGGINPHAVDHTVRMGGKIVWMPTLAAKNHIDKSSTETKNFPKSEKPMLKARPLTVLDDNGKLTQDTIDVLDVIAEGDIILAGGHLSIHEMRPMFAEAKRRGVKKMIVNHPTYVIGCSDEDIRDLVGLGVKMEHSICMFVEGRAHKYGPDKLAHLIEVAGVDNTLLCSDLGLQGSPRPVDGYRSIVGTLLDLQFGEKDIRKLVGKNAAQLL